MPSYQHIQNIHFWTSDLPKTPTLKVKRHELAKRLLACVRAEDTVARLGGDEFVMLLEGLADSKGAVAVAQKIMDAINRPLNLEDREVFVTASIGISIYPGDGDSAIDLIKNADAAMYRAKDKGRDNYQLYSSELSIAALNRFNLENDLRKALGRDEFIL